ncbi:hypothetical protein NT6N_24640 [Oceaniferula spumae]|uniref:Lipoprotein n=1 Tax=Oceaniferula spumae TaxID=2979115 RepID=A0AAT9FN88_9BACT
MFVVALAVLGCRNDSPDISTEHPIQDEYIHCHVDGGWGIDADIWIYRDDSFRVEYSGKSTETWDGRNQGLYQSLINTFDHERYWEVTTDTLDAEVKASAKYSRNMMVIDASHDYLKVVSPSKTLNVDFYAARTLADYYGDTPKLKIFGEVIWAIHEGTKK